MADDNPDAMPDAPARPAAPDAADLAVAGLAFDNRTPYSALQFDIVDQHGGAFHVFVAKIGYALGACDAQHWAGLTELAAPAELNTTDRHVDDNPAASVLEESDLAPHKPRCDVIVVGSAYAPKGVAVDAFPVRLAVDTAGQKAKRPVDKVLVVSGGRQFQKRGVLTRLLGLPVRLATLGLASLGTWTLSLPGRLAQLPLRYEYAEGGQCRINRDDPAAGRLDKKYRLPDSAKPLPPGDAIAHEACETNPVGRGFTRQWFLAASQTNVVDAAQITRRDSPCSAKQFMASAKGVPLPEPAGFGPIGRAWLPRRRLIGKIEETTHRAENAVRHLPAEFDFGYWNCAPRDQQCDYLRGQARIALTNVCRHDAPFAWVDEAGNTMLRLVLPRQELFVLAANGNKELITLRLDLDTVCLKPDGARLDLVWRGNLPADIGIAAARLMHVTEAAQIERLDTLVRQQWGGDGTAAAPAAR